MTYRVGGKNYLILAPINGRRWDVWKPLNTLPELPEELQPYDRNNVSDVLQCLSWQVGKQVRNGSLHGYEDVDLAFMVYLVSCGLTIEQIHEAFQLVFYHDYDFQRTEYIYQRTKEKIEAGDSVRGPGSFVQKVKELDLKIIDRFCKELQRVTGVKPKAEVDLSKALRKGSELQLLDIPIEWAVQGLIPLESITLLSAKGGMGKTTIVGQAGDAISKGNDFLGLKIIKRPVIYIDFENSLPVLIERIKNIGASEIFFWHTTNEIKPPRLDSQEWVLYKQLPNGAVLIFDTLRASQNKDENDSQHMAFIMQRVKELRDLGYTIIILHHTPKSNEKIYKGSTAIYDLSDHVLSLYKVKKGRDEEIEDDFDTEDYSYRLGTKDKTRYEPFSIFLDFDKEQHLFVLAPNPIDEKLRTIYEILKECPEPPNQTKFTKLIKEEFDYHYHENRRLIKRGIGTYWETEKGEKNATIYIPLNSVIQFSTSIYNRKTEKQDSTRQDKTKNTPSPNNTRLLDNTEFASFSEGVRKTEKQDSEPIYINTEVE